MVITTGFVIFATGKIQEEQWLNKLTGSQWDKVAGMLEAGVWQSPTAAKGLHPNQILRHRTPFPRKN